jgi:hypothetical protein
LAEKYFKYYKIKKMKNKHIVLRVAIQPKNPFSIRTDKGRWLCANSANSKNWHYSNSPGSTGVTEYTTFADANKVCDKLQGHEVVEFKE